MRINLVPRPHLTTCFLDHSRTNRLRLGPSGSWCLEGVRVPKADWWLLLTKGAGSSQGWTGCPFSLWHGPDSLYQPLREQQSQDCHHRSSEAHTGSDVRPLQCLRLCSPYWWDGRSSIWVWCPRNGCVLSRTHRHQPPLYLQTSLHSAASWARKGYASGAFANHASVYIYVNMAEWERADLGTKHRNAKQI